jgi:hypothetical protein
MSLHLLLRGEYDCNAVECREPSDSGVYCLCGCRRSSYPDVLEGVLFQAVVHEIEELLPVNRGHHTLG